MNFIDTFVPSAPVEADQGNPSSIIIISGPKIGKTTIAATLPDALHIVCDPNGGDFVRSVRVDVNRDAIKAGVTRYDFVMQLCAELARQEPRRFKRIVIDKLDNLEEWADIEATGYYKQTIVGRTFKGRSVREIDKGGGYSYFWDSFRRIWNTIVSAADEVVFLAGLKETELDRQGLAQTFTKKDMDLTGKVRNIAASFADVLGLMSRNEKDENWITFATRDTGVLAGSRIASLEGKLIRISWKDKNGAVMVDWSKIFKDVPPVEAPIVESATHESHETTSTETTTENRKDD